MDSLSQVLLGSATTGALGAKKYGNKALIWGGVLGTIPDLDVFVGPLLFDNPLQADFFHRSISHSLLFAVVGGMLFGILMAVFARKGSKKDIFALRSLIALVAFATHSVLDLLTGYGTQILWPFSMEWFALDSVFIVDPAYTLPLLVCWIVSLFLKNKRKKRIVSLIGLGVSTLYLLWGWAAQGVARDALHTSLVENNLTDVDLITISASPMNTILRRGLAENEEEYYQAWYSLLDDALPTQRYTIPKNHALLEKLTDDADIASIVDRWSDIAVEQTTPNTYLLHVMRMSKPLGRVDYDSMPFLFSYQVTIDDNGDITVGQDMSSARGGMLFDGWGQALLDRIGGVSEDPQLHE